VVVLGCGVLEKLGDFVGEVNVDAAGSSSSSISSRCSGEVRDGVAYRRT
jgi:hypothetical protein